MTLRTIFGNERLAEPVADPPGVGALVKIARARRKLPVSNGSPEDVTEVLVVDDSKVMREMIVACLRAHPGSPSATPRAAPEAIERLSLRNFTSSSSISTCRTSEASRCSSSIGGQDKLRALPNHQQTRGTGASRPRALGAGADRFIRLCRLRLTSPRSVGSSAARHGRDGRNVDLGDFVEAFLGEAEDLLRALSANLLDRGNGGEGRQNLRAAGGVGATHTLKGLAAMVAIEPIVAIAHRMESLLRAADAAGEG